MDTGSGAVIIIADAPSEPEQLIETIDGSEVVLDDAPATVSDIEIAASEAVEEIKQEINNSEDSKWQELINQIANMTTLLTATLETVNRQQTSMLEVMQSAAMNYNNLTNQITSMLPTPDMIPLQESIPAPAPEPEPEKPAAASNPAEKLPEPAEDQKPRKRWI